MTLGRNIIAGYLGQIYVTVAGVLMLPLYLKYMGAEPYGLVGFFAVLQTLFNLLDIGMAPTLARETARFYAGASTALAYRRLLRALQLIFWCTAGVGGLGLFLLAEPIATRWLNVQTLSPIDSMHAIQLMAICVALRWASGLYRAVVSGANQLVWLNGANALVATFRFVGVIPILLYAGATPDKFFSYQVAVALLEVVVFAGKAHRLAPRIQAQEPIGWTFCLLFKPVKAVAAFSLTIAFTSSIWALVTQTDKLLLSRMLNLADYGYFTLAVLVASVVATISSPISAAAIPQLNQLYAAGKNLDAIELYRHTTRMVSTITFPLAGIIAYFAHDILLLWTQDQMVADTCADTLALYALGYAVLAVAGLPSLIQAAQGNLKLHVVGSLLFVCIYAPVLFALVMQWGLVGAGAAWLLVNSLYLLTWVPRIHFRFSASLHQSWLSKDIATALVSVLIITVTLKAIYVSPNNRWLAICLLIAITGICLVCSYILSNMLYRLFIKTTPPSIISNE